MTAKDFIIVMSGRLDDTFVPLTPIIEREGLCRTSGWEFSFDYLMPAELFPAVLAGGVLPIWAAHRARLSQRFIGWGFGLAIVLLVASQGLAVVSGLASGESETAGVWSFLVMGLLIAYDLAAILLSVGGILLLGDLFKRP